MRIRYKRHIRAARIVRTGKNQFSTTNPHDGTLCSGADHALSLPEQLLTKAPADGFSGMSDEKKLGFTYEILGDYIETGVCPDSAIREKIDLLHEKNLHKLKPIPFYQKKNGCRLLCVGYATEA